MGGWRNWKVAAAPREAILVLRGEGEGAGNGACVVVCTLLRYGGLEGGLKGAGGVGAGARPVSGPYDYLHR